MGKRHPNYRLVKINRNYTVEETSNLFGIHKNTVRAWIRAGLETINDKRPILILGLDLASFLKERRAKNKQPCRQGNSIVSGVAHRKFQQDLWRNINLLRENLAI